jgi:hypothetical protein
MNTRHPAVTLIALVLACLVVSAPSAQAAPPSDEPIETATNGRCNLSGNEDLRSALIRVIVLCRQELGVSDAQLERIERLALDLARQQIRRRADLEVAVLELMVVLDADPSDPARPADVAAAESKIRDVARITADGEIARMRVLESLKGVLDPEQRVKLAALMDDPLDAARAPGGGAPGGRPSGGPASGGHPPGGGAPRGAPPHPPGGSVRPPHPPAHPGFDGRHGFRPHVWIGVQPWIAFDPFWPSYAYPMPAPRAYWYFCASAGAYYPYVQTCPEGWVTVVP